MTFQRFFANQKMTHRCLDRMHGIHFRHSNQLARANAALCDGAVECQYLDLGSTLDAVTVRLAPFTAAQHKDLVTLRCDKNFLCVHTVLVYNRP